MPMLPGLVAKTMAMCQLVSVADPEQGWLFVRGTDVLLDSIYFMFDLFRFISEKPTRDIA